MVCADLWGDERVGGGVGGMMMMMMSSGGAVLPVGSARLVSTRLVSGWPA
ncbi:MAG: hypothetical protein ABGY24_04070 [bacterium]